MLKLASWYQVVSLSAAKIRRDQPHSEIAPPGRARAPSPPSGIGAFARIRKQYDTLVPYLEDSIRGDAESEGRSEITLKDQAATNRLGDPSFRAR